MKRMYHALLIVLFAIGLFAVSNPVLAVTVSSGDAVRIDFQGENETRIISGRNVELTGESAGDVYVFAGSLISKAAIHGDLVVFAGEALISGEVAGNIRGATGKFTFNGKTRNVTVAAGNLALGDQAEAHDVFAASGESSVQGAMRNLAIASGKMHLNGSIQEDARLAVEQATFGSSASITGNLVLKSKIKPQGFDSIAVGGNREFREVQHRKPVASVFDGILKMFSLLALVYVLWALPGIKNAILSFQPSAKNVLLPIVWATLIPIAAIILLITMIGVPIALVLGALAFIGAVIAKSFAVIFLGSAFATKQMTNIHLTLIVVSIVSVLLGFIPYIGWIISLVLCLLGWAIAIHLFRTAVK